MRHYYYRYMYIILYSLRDENGLTGESAAATVYRFGPKSIDRKPSAVKKHRANGSIYNNNNYYAVPMYAVRMTREQNVYLLYYNIKMFMLRTHNSTTYNDV